MKVKMYKQTFVCLRAVNLISSTSYTYLNTVKLHYMYFFYSTIVNAYKRVECQKFDRVWLSVVFL